MSVNCSIISIIITVTIPISYGMRERGTRNRGIRTRLGGLHPPLNHVNVYMAKFDPAERITLPWVTEVFLACGGNFRCWPKVDTSSAVGQSCEKNFFARVTMIMKTWQKPETALEKSLAPRVGLPALADRATRLGGSPHISWFKSLTGLKLCATTWNRVCKRNM